MRRRATGLAEGTPVAAGSIDSWAEVTAAGLRGPGEGLLVYGTSMFLAEVGSPARLDARLWRTVGFTPGSHNAAAGVGSSGALAAWLRQLAGGAPYDELFEEAESAGPGAGGLLALPYFAGERTPWFDPDLRGALFGLTAAHRRGHVLRALLEATAFAVRHNLETMHEAGATISSLRSGGGGAAHPLWPQIVSDVTGLAQDVRGGSDRRRRRRGALRRDGGRRCDPRDRMAESGGTGIAARGAATAVRRALRPVPRAGARDTASRARARRVAARAR